MKIPLNIPSQSYFKQSSLLSESLFVMIKTQSISTPDPAEQKMLKQYEIKPEMYFASNILSMHILYGLYT